MNRPGAGHAGQAPTPPPGTGGSSEAAPAPAPPATPRSPLVIGSVGNLSGPVGATLLPILRGGQVWVQAVNRKGGLDGRQVKLLTWDDGGDPARRKAALREAVERQHVVAFFVEAAPLTGEATIDYLNEKQIPVIGTDTGGSYPSLSPMYFVQGTFGIDLFNSVIFGAARQLVPTGKAKLATISCVEVAQCEQVIKAWAAAAGEAGFDLVHTVRGTLTQPDYTAECLAAARAGADVVAVGLDTNSFGRYAASCARQGFKPLLMTPSGLVSHAWKDDAVIRNTFLGVSNFYPYFLAGRPALDEYQAAKAIYGRDLEGMGPLTGWVGGKLLERVAANLPEPPTSRAILENLWALKDETLGGLSAAPLNFPQGKNAHQPMCWYDVSLRDGKWVSPDGGQRHCH